MLAATKIQASFRGQRGRRVGESQRSYQVSASSQWAPSSACAAPSPRSNGSRRFMNVNGSMVFAKERMYKTNRRAMRMWTNKALGAGTPHNMDCPPKR